MKLGIMQPYLFPYLGYFQLIAAVDKFVIHDDVQFIKGGWINRNRILLSAKPHLFTFPVKKDSFILPINKRVFAPELAQSNKKFLSLLYTAYHKAPFFKKVQSVIEEILSYQDRNVAAFSANSLLQLCRYMHITTPIFFSSKIKKNNDLKGQERVILINKIMKSTHYINPVGGVALYQKKVFKDHGILLYFIRMRDVVYSQFAPEFIPNLSIIDVLMYNDIKIVKKMLSEYDLV